MNKNAFLILVCLLCVLNFSCGKQNPSNAERNTPRTKEAPLWIFDIKSVFPEKEYVVAVGEGGDANSSKQKALSELASYFGTVVSSDLQATTTATQTTMQDESVTATTKSLTEIVNVSSGDVALFGVEYNETFFDSQRGLYYTAAFINRQKAVPQFLPQIENDKIEFYSFYDDAKKTLDSDPFTAYINFVAAEPKIKKFAADIVYLRVVDLEKSRAYEEDAKNLAAFAKQKEDAKNKSVLVVQLKGEKDVDGIIETAARKMVSSKGFTISQNASSAFYIFQCNIDGKIEETLEYGETIFSAIPTVGLSIIKKSDGKTVWSTSVSASKKEIAVTLNAAKKKAYQDIAKKIAVAMSELE